MGISSSRPCGHRGCCSQQNCSGNIDAAPHPISNGTRNAGKDEGYETRTMSFDLIHLQNIDHEEDYDDAAAESDEASEHTG